MNVVSECTTKFKLYLLSSLKLLIQNDLLVLFLVFYHQRKNSVKFLYLFVGGETSSHIRDIELYIDMSFSIKRISQCHGLQWFFDMVQVQGVDCPSDCTLQDFDSCTIVKNNLNLEYCGWKFK
jgi:hypothetical protein